MITLAMTPRLKVGLALVILILLGVGAVAVHVHRVREATAISAMYTGIRPVPKSYSRISASVLTQLLAADFRVVHDLQNVPSLVKESFCNVEQCDYVGIKFDMVNPGDVMSTDYIMEGVPNKRLRFAALNSQTAILVYERGGFANRLRVAVFDFRNGCAWDSTLNSYDVRSMHDLRKALAQEIHDGA